MDLDLGNYERYLLTTLTRDHNITTGKIYQHVIERERVGQYLGKTVQVYVLIPPEWDCSDNEKRTTYHQCHSRLDRARCQGPY